MGALTKALAPLSKGSQVIRMLQLRMDTSPVARWSVFMMLGIITIATPLVVNDYFTVIFTECLFYVVMCLGLNVVVGFAGLLDLGYAAFFAIGAYSTGILTVNYGVNFWIAIPCAIVIAAFSGVIIGAPTLRLRSDYLAIVTLGFGEIVRLIARNLNITGGPSGLSGIPSPTLFGWSLSSSIIYYYIFLVLAVGATIASYRLYDSRLGRAWLYVRFDEDVAAAMGINRVRVKLAAYVIGAIYGAIGGVFYAANLGAISPPSFSFTQSLLFLMAVILGGMGKIPGVIAGAFLVVLGPELLRFMGDLRLLVFAVLMLIVILIKPSGLWPDKAA